MKDLMQGKSKIVENTLILTTTHNMHYTIRVSSHGDFLKISLIFGVQFSIIHNKLNIESIFK